MDVEWEDPPARKVPSNRGTGRTERFVAVLREHPGKWAKYPVSFTQGSMVTTFRKRFPGTEWTARKGDDGRYAIYGRWVGDE